MISDKRIKEAAQPWILPVSKDAFQAGARFAIAELEPKLKNLQAEVAIARERLGPAGWYLLEELKSAREALRAFRGHQHPGGRCHTCEVLAKYDAVVAKEKV